MESLFNAIPMKKIIYLLIVACTLMLIGCSHDFDTNIAENVTNKYNTAFVQTFGQPAVNQTWGFSEITTTRASQPESNMWKDWGYKVPNAITADEITKVKKVFDEKGEASYEALVDWDYFFVQHVYGNHSNMDWLCAYDPEGHDAVEYVKEYNYQEHHYTSYDDHIYNFNATSGNIQLMVNSSTHRFGFHSSQDSKMHYWFRMEEIDGAYYVGIDYEATGENSNQQEARDYIYNDWIIKICPGKGSTPPVNNVRIMVEDLSASTGTDFDFNDAVIDVNIVNGNAECILQAAGGTLPLKIENFEVHELFGVATNVMVNTGAGPSLDPVPFTLTGITNPKDIHIYVDKGNWIEVTANKGNPASKIATWQDKEWCRERQPISEKYPGFPHWVSNPDIVW